MGRKAISKYKLNKIKALLTEGKTSKEIAALLNISTASVSNYRAYFKKKGDLKETNKSLNNIGKKEIESNFTYTINGTQLKFIQKPKSIIIGVNELIIDF